MARDAASMTGRYPGCARRPSPRSRDIGCSWPSAASLSLGFLRRPAVGLGGGAAHQHRPLAVAQTVGLEKRLGRLLVIDHGEGPRPIGAPQAALDSPGIEDALQRVPDIVVGKRLLRQGAGAADFDHRILALGELQYFR